MAATYVCPACSAPFKLRSKGRCPACGVELYSEEDVRHGLLADAVDGFWWDRGARAWKPVRVPAGR